jgi:dienelactone hydrolase
MRLLEILIAGLLFLAIVIRFIPSLREKMHLPYLSLIAALLIPIHLLLDGFRWQMLPLFVFTLVFILFRLGQYYLRSGKDHLIRNKILRIAGRVFIILLYFGALIFPLLLPIVHLPEPGGPFAVGTMSFRMTDHGREELFTEDSLDTRNLLVNVWYPAEGTEEMPVSRYWDKDGNTGKVYSESAGMGTFWYTHLSLVKTNSYSGASVLSGKSPFPVIMYSPSFYGMNSENTMLLEELASHGYVVFSITHTYETIVSVFPDGETIPGNLDHISGLYDSNADQEDLLYEKYKRAKDFGRKTDIIRQILVVDELFNQLVRIRMEDAIFVLDEIERLNKQEGIFHSKLDMNRVGMFGWSFGGAATTETCIADSRLKAGINIDGWPYGALFSSAEPLSQAMMLIQSGSEDEEEDEQEKIISELIFDKSENAAYGLQIKGTSHMNFWDFPLFFRIYKLLGYWDEIDPLRLLEIESVYIKGFFDKHLIGKNVDLPAGGSDLFPEVSLEIKESAY